MKQLIRYRTCDRCPGTTKAAVTDKLTFNGSRYDLDLCEKHSLEMFQAIMAWADVGTKTGDTGIFDRQKAAAEITVKLPPPKTEPTFTPAPTPIRTVLADDPSLPLTASRWQLSRHAQERLTERGFTLAEVLWAAERPAWTKTVEDDDGLLEHTKDRCTAVVNPHECVIITVLYAEGEDVAFAAAQGKAQN